MNTINQLVHGSGQPNFALLDMLTGWQSKAWAYACIAGLILLLATAVSLIFNSPAAYQDLHGFNCSLLILIGSALSYLVHKPKTPKRVWLTCLTAVLMLTLAAYSLLEAWLQKQWIIQSIVKSELTFEPLTEFGIQSYVFFILYSLICCLEVFAKKPWWKVLDILTLVLAFNLLLLSFGFCLQLISAATNATQAFYSFCITTCIFAMFAVLLVKRVQAGIFSVFVSLGIGSEVSRKILPVLTLLPLCIMVAFVLADSFALFSLIQIATMIAAIAACGLVALAMRLASQVNALEKNLLDMSLMDDLTNIYNRRGFYLLGEHMLREGKRSGDPVMVLFFDLDGLKEVNDTLGHDKGSALLTNFAELLRSNFRNCDVVARVGGDEFAVVTQQDAYKIVLNRLKNSIESENRKGDNGYRICYSVGVASTGRTRGDEKFDDLVKQADALMYERKKLKRTRTGATLLDKITPEVVTPS